MSSIKPRAFINEPRATDSRRGTFLSHATTVHETPFPMIDSRSIPTVTAHSFGLLTRPIWVFSPEYTKNSGSNNVVTSGSSLAVSCWAKKPDGIAAPRTNAPNIA